MKTSFTTSWRLALLLSIAMLLASATMAQVAPNYFQIRNGWQSYYDANPLLKTTPGTGYKDFIRWQMFWQNRVQSVDSTRNGMFSNWKENLKKYAETIEAGSPGISSNWRFLGPEGIAEQCHGLVNAIYVDTVNDKSFNTIYAGTNSSGIWKTTDGGANWHNITDNSGFWLIGVNHITGDPNNGNILYACTGGSFPNSSDGLERVLSNLLTMGTRGLIYFQGHKYILTIL